MPLVYPANRYVPRYGGRCLSESNAAGSPGGWLRSSLQGRCPPNQMPPARPADRYVLRYSEGRNLPAFAEAAYAV